MTRNGTRIPLLTLFFNYQLYKQGEEKNCLVEYHPSFRNDERLKQMSFEMIDYIRENYDMEEIL
jgi:hypothetical protein